MRWSGELRARSALAVMLSGLSVMFLAGPASGQSGEQAADQAAFQDDADLLQLNNAQVRQLEEQEQSAEMQAGSDEQRNNAYRLYATKRIQELEKLKGKNADNDQQIAILQNWLKSDAAMRLRDQQTINSLRQRIASMEQNQQRLMSSLGADVGAVRQAAQDASDAGRFQRQMQMNYFNEMQTEMGPASWYGHPTDGVSYSMGGMGFNGGQSLFGGY